MRQALKKTSFLWNYFSVDILNAYNPENPIDDHTLTRQHFLIKTNPNFIFFDNQNQKSERLLNVAKFQSQLNEEYKNSQQKERDRVNKSKAEEGSISAWFSKATEKVVAAFKDERLGQNDFEDFVLRLLDEFAEEFLTFRDEYMIATRLPLSSKESLRLLRSILLKYTEQNLAKIQPQEIYTEIQKIINDHFPTSGEETLLYKRIWGNRYPSLEDKTDEERTRLQLSCQIEKNAESNFEDYEKAVVKAKRAELKAQREMREKEFQLQRQRLEEEAKMRAENSKNFLLFLSADLSYHKISKEIKNFMGDFCDSSLSQSFDALEKSAQSRIILHLSFVKEAIAFELKSQGASEVQSKFLAKISKLLILLVEKEFVKEKLSIFENPSFLDVETCIKSFTCFFEGDIPIDSSKLNDYLSSLQAEKLKQLISDQIFPWNCKFLSALLQETPDVFEAHFIQSLLGAADAFKYFRKAYEAERKVSLPRVIWMSLFRHFLKIYDHLFLQDLFPVEVSEKFKRLLNKELELEISPASMSYWAMIAPDLLQEKNLPNFDEFYKNKPKPQLLSDCNDYLKILVSSFAWNQSFYSAVLQDLQNKDKNIPDYEFSDFRISRQKFRTFLDEAADKFKEFKDSFEILHDGRPRLTRAEWMQVFEKFLRMYSEQCLDHEVVKVAFEKMSERFISSVKGETDEAFNLWKKISPRDKDQELVKNTPEEFASRVRRSSILCQFLKSDKEIQDIPAYFKVKFATELFAIRNCTKEIYEVDAFFCVQTFIDYFKSLADVDQGLLFLKHLIASNKALLFSRDKSFKCIGKSMNSLIEALVINNCVDSKLLAKIDAETPVIKFKKKKNKKACRIETNSQNSKNDFDDNSDRDPSPKSSRSPSPILFGVENTSATSSMIETDSKEGAENSNVDNSNSEGNFLTLEEPRSPSPIQLRAKSPASTESLYELNSFHVSSQEEVQDVPEKSPTPDHPTLKFPNLGDRSQIAKQLKEFFKVEISAERKAKFRYGFSHEDSTVREQNFKNFLEENWKPFLEYLVQYRSEKSDPFPLDGEILGTLFWIYLSSFSLDKDSAVIPEDAREVFVDFFKGHEKISSDNLLAICNYRLAVSEVISTRAAKESFAFCLKFVAHNNYAQYRPSQLDCVYEEAPPAHQEGSQDSPVQLRENQEVQEVSTKVDIIAPSAQPQLPEKEKEEEQPIDLFIANKTEILFGFLGKKFDQFNGRKLLAIETREVFAMEARKLFGEFKLAAESQKQDKSVLNFYEMPHYFPVGFSECFKNKLEALEPNKRESYLFNLISLREEMKPKLVKEPILPKQNFYMRLCNLIVSLEFLEIQKIEEEVLRRRQIEDEISQLLSFSIRDLEHKIAEEIDFSDFGKLIFKKLPEENSSEEKQNMSDVKIAIAQVIRETSAAIVEHFQPAFDNPHKLEEVKNTFDANVKPKFQASIERQNALKSYGESVSEILWRTIKRIAFFLLLPVGIGFVWAGWRLGGGLPLLPGTDTEPTTFSKSLMEIGEKTFSSMQQFFGKSIPKEPDLNGEAAAPQAVR